MLLSQKITLARFACLCFIVGTSTRTVLRVVFLPLDQVFGHNTLRQLHVFCFEFDSYVYSVKLFQERAELNQ